VSQLIGGQSNEWHIGQESLMGTTLTEFCFRKKMLVLWPLPPQSLWALIQPVCPPQKLVRTQWLQRWCYEICQYDGGMIFAVCPCSGNWGRAPNHDIFHSSVSWMSFCSSGVKWSNTDTAFINCIAWTQRHKSINCLMYHCQLSGFIKNQFNLLLHICVIYVQVHSMVWEQWTAGTNEKLLLVSGSPTVDEESINASVCFFPGWNQCFECLSVLWCCWFGDRNDIGQIKFP